MKKLSTLLLIVFGAMFSANAQNWIEDFYLPTNTKSGASFYQRQKDFNEYWSKYDVQGGYYFIDGVKHKAGGWKQFKRWEWFWETRIDPKTGNMPAINPFTIQQEFLKSSKGKAGDLSNWESMGPSGSEGGYAGVGRINCVAFHPSNPNIFWVGAPSGGLWKTIDGGQSWDILTDNLPVIGVSEIIIPNDYETSKTIYIATGDRDAGDNNSIGVLKTTDDGQTWQPTGFSLDISSGYRITRMFINPVDPNVFYASTNGGIAKTSDAWESWKLVQKGLFFDMEMQPNSNGEVLFAVTASYSDSSRIYKSVDAAETWYPVHGFQKSTYRVELDVAPSNPNVVYALASNTAGGMDGIFKSIDAGETFDLVYGGAMGGYNLLNWYENSTAAGGQGWFDLTLSVSPVDENTIYLGGVNSWKSTDGGYNWSIVNHWYGANNVPAVHADKHYMEYMDENTFFEGNDGGIYKTTDGGKSWVDLTNGLVISQMYKLGVSQTVKDEVITGLQDNGSKLTSGGTWWDVKGGDGMECIIDYTDVKVQYATYVNGQIDRSLNRWTTRSVDISANIPGGENGAWVTPYLIDPFDNKTLYVGYEDIWKTEDRGDSWTKISNLNISNKVRTMAISESNPNYLYIADLYSMYSTANGGEEWVNLTENLPPYFNSITYISIDNKDSKHIWITSGGYVGGEKVYESFDGGKTWANISEGLPNVPANTIIENKLSRSKQQLYVGTDMGVFFREDNNAWSLYSNNLPTVVVTELEIHYDTESPESSVLYASTYGRGLWKSIVAPFEIAEMVLGTVKGPIYVSNEVPAIFMLIHTLYESFSSNTFTAYLSNGNGDFTSSAVIGEFRSDEERFFSVEIPKETASGTDYKIKVHSSNSGLECDVSNTFEIILDNEKPTISITSSIGESTSETGFDVNIEFSEAVEGFEQSNISISNADISKFDASKAPLYTIGISPIMSNIVTVSVPADVVTDIIGNSNSASNEWSTMFTVTSVENLAANGLIVYPNPSDGHIMVNFDKQFKKAILSVYDITGKLLESKVLTQTKSAQVDLSSLSKGIYILKINIDGKEVNSKLIIE